MDVEMVCWDFDGPVVQSDHFTHGLRQKQYAGLDFETYIDWHNRGNFFDELDRSGLPLTDKSFNYDAEYTRGITRIEPFAGVPGVMKEIHRLGLTQSVISGNHGGAIAVYLMRYGLLDYFPVVLGSDHHKSKVVKFNTLMENYELTADHIVYVTDTVGDLVELRGLVRCIAVTYGFCSEDVLRAANPAKLISSPGELMQAIQELQVELA